MAEWQLLHPYQIDRKATGLMCWPARDGEPEEIRFGKVWDHWATFDRPTYWIPCAAPGSPPSPIMRLRLLFSRLLYRIWPRDDMTETFLDHCYWEALHFLSWPWRALRPRAPEARFTFDLDDELPF